MSTDGARWTAVDGTVDGKPFGRDVAGQPALHGSTGGKWLDVKVPLSAYAGKKVQFRFAYLTDGAVVENGFFADEITLTADGVPVFTDGAESGTGGWTATGRFKRTTGTEVNDFDNYYIASHRTYVSYDKYLRTGPYNYPDPVARPNWVERFPYQQGLLISYWNTQYEDNNASKHPGEGQMLVIDSRPKPVYNLTGQPWRPRFAGYDAPFSLTKADSLTLKINGKPNYFRGQPANPVFDDSKQYWFPDQPTAGVKVPNAGVRIRLLKTKGTSATIRVESSKPSPAAKR
jgi:immune inhibitor A